MVSQYDVFYAIANAGSINIEKILEYLNKPKQEYQNIFNNILVLEKKGLVKREDQIKIVHSEKSKQLFNIISFCIRNGMNYNIFLKPKMINFLEKASKIEFFTITNIKLHPTTFHFYVNYLSKCGLLLIISKKPLKCKLLRSQFITEICNLFAKKIKFYNPKKRLLISEIGKELKKYKRNAKINQALLGNIESKRAANFIYSSLSLEGNPLTLPETQKLILEHVTDSENADSVQEALNYSKAINEMRVNANNKIKLNKDLISHYHYISMFHKTFAGQIRKENVFIKKNPQFKTSDWKEINIKLDKLIEDYSNFEFKKRNAEEIIRFASYFHNEFQRIHPFIDGNSRISRLLMLHILRMHSLPILDLPIGYFDMYLELTKKSQKRDDEAFFYLLQELVLINLKRLNSSITH